MNGFTKRIATIAAAGLVTVSGVAMLAQPAFAADKNPVSISSFLGSCKGTGGSTSGKANAAGDALVSITCTYSNDDGTHSKFTCPVSGTTVDVGGKCTYTTAKTTSPLRRLTVKSAGFVAVTTTGTRIKVATSAVTGITTIKTPGSKPVVVVPATAVTGPGSPVVKPVIPVAQPTPTPTTPHAGTGIVTKPGGAIG